MIVLDEHQVIETDAMIAPAPASHGVFLEAPPAGCGFARVENLRVRVFDGVHELRGERGDAGKPLHKIQRDAFSGENRARWTGNLQQRFAVVHALAVSDENFDLNRRSADIPVCGFTRHSCLAWLAAGGWKAARTRRLESLRYIGTREYAKGTFGKGESSDD